MKKYITENQFNKALSIVRAYKLQEEQRYLKSVMKMEKISAFMSVNNDTPIANLPLAKKTHNVLREVEGLNYYDDTLEQLSNVSLALLLRYRGAGKQVIEELQQLCMYTGINMKP